MGRLLQLNHKQMHRWPHLLSPGATPTKRTGHLQDPAQETTVWRKYSHAPKRLTFLAPKFHGPHHKVRRTTESELTRSQRQQDYPDDNEQVDLVPYCQKVRNTLFLSLGVPNIVGTRDRFRGSRFLQTRVRRDGFRMIPARCMQTHLLLCDPGPNRPQTSPEVREPGLS